MATGCHHAIWPILRRPGCARLSDRVPPPTLKPQTTGTVTSQAFATCWITSPARIRLSDGQGLSGAYRGVSEGAALESLYEQFFEDRGVVEAILAELGYSSRSAKRLAGQATGSALRAVAGGAPGARPTSRPGWALAIGVQGKRCLWRAAQALDSLPHPPGRRGFVELEADAVHQWETIERHRRSLAPLTFGA